MFSLPKSLDGHMGRASDWWTLCGPGGVVWAIMSVAGHGVAWIAPYGWGAAVFVGFAAACFFMLAASVLLLSWSLFRSYAAHREDGRVAASHSGKNEGLFRSYAKKRRNVSLETSVNVSRIEARMPGSTAEQFEIKLIVFNGSGTDIKIGQIKGAIHFHGAIWDGGRFIHGFERPELRVMSEGIIPAFKENSVTICQKISPHVAQSMLHLLSEGKGIYLNLANLDLQIMPVGSLNMVERLAIWGAIECYPSRFGVHVVKYIHKSSGSTDKNPRIEDLQVLEGSEDQEL